MIFKNRIICSLIFFVEKTLQKFAKKQMEDFRNSFCNFLFDYKYIVDQIKQTDEQADITNGFTITEEIDNDQISEIFNDAVLEQFYSNDDNSEIFTLRSITESLDQLCQIQYNIFIPKIISNPTRKQQTILNTFKIIPLSLQGFDFSAFSEEQSQSLKSYVDQFFNKFLIANNTLIHIEELKESIFSELRNLEEEKKEEIPETPEEEKKEENQEIEEKEDKEDEKNEKYYKNLLYQEKRNEFRRQFQEKYDMLKDIYLLNQKIEIAKRYLEELKTNSKTLSENNAIVKKQDKIKKLKLYITEKQAGYNNYRMLSERISKLDTECKELKKKYDTQVEQYQEQYQIIQTNTELLLDYIKTHRKERKPVIGMA